MTKGVSERQTVKIVKNFVPKFKI